MNETKFDVEMKEGVHMEDGHKSVYALTKHECLETAFVCCDCGLVHLVEIEHDADEVRLTWHRGDALTQEFRDQASKARAAVLSSRRVSDEFARVRRGPNKAISDTARGRNRYSAPQ